MKKKIIGIVVCTLLIATVFSSTTTAKSINISEENTTNDVDHSFLKDVSLEEIRKQILDFEPEPAKPPMNDLPKIPRGQAGMSPLEYEPPWDEDFWVPEIYKFGASDAWQEGTDTTSYYGKTHIHTWAAGVGVCHIIIDLCHGFYFKAPFTDTYTFKFTYSVDGYVHGEQGGVGYSLAASQVWILSYVYGEKVNKDRIIFHEALGIIGEYTDDFDKTKTYTMNVALTKGTEYYIGGQCTFRDDSLGALFAGASTESHTQGDHARLKKVVIDWPNHPPDKPSNPTPPDGQTDVTIKPTLKWSCSDPDGDPLTYDIYLGTSSSPPKVKSNHNEKYYSPGTLKYNTKYYWKIVARDSHGATTSGPIWDFTTEEEEQSCFPAGTKITMADGSYKNIEDINVGDKVLSYNVENKEFTSWKVKVLERPIVRVYNINNGLIKTSRDHPFYIKKQDGRTGWGAIEPLQNAFRIPGEILKIEVGDQLFTSDGKWITVTDIEYNPTAVQTYNILSYLGNKNYFANDLLVYEDYQTLSYLIRQAFQKSRNPSAYLLDFFRQRNYRFLPYSLLSFGLRNVRFN